MRILGLEISERRAEMLVALVLNNARETAHGYWEEGDTEEYTRIIGALERCESGKGSEEDWDALIEVSQL